MTNDPAPEPPRLFFLFHWFLKIISLAIDHLVIKLEHSVTGLKPIVGKTKDFSAYNKPEYLERPELFFDAGTAMPDVEETPRHVFMGVRVSHYRFRSATESGYENNDMVVGRIFEAREMHGGADAPCVIMMHGWREAGSMTPYHYLMGWLFARFGINAVFMTQPFHAHRKPPGTADGDLMLCGDAERTILSFRQSVGDCRSLITWAQQRFNGPVGVGGFSLGGFITNIVACVDARIRFALPVIASGDMVTGMWDSPVVKKVIRDFRASGLSEQDVADAFRIIRPVLMKPKLPPDRIQIIAGVFDVLIPDINVRALWSAWNAPRLLWLHCGHVSIFLFPGKLMQTMIRFIKHTCADHQPSSAQATAPQISS